MIVHLLCTYFSLVPLTWCVGLIFVLLSLCFMFWPTFFFLHLSPYHFLCLTIFGSFGFFFPESLFISILFRKCTLNLSLTLPPPTHYGTEWVKKSKLNKKCNRCRDMMYGRVETFLPTLTQQFELIWPNDSIFYSQLVQDIRIELDKFQQIFSHFIP